MHHEGNLRKLESHLTDPVEYGMPLGKMVVPLKPLIGKYISLQYKELINCMKSDNISLPEKIEQLKKEHAKPHKDPEFKKCKNMGEIVKESLKMVFTQPLRKKYSFVLKK